MKKRLIAFIKYLFFLGIGAFLVWWSLHQIPSDKWGEFKNALRTAKFGLIAPVFLILSLSHVLRALRWRILMEPMGYKPGVANSFFAVMIGYLANLAVPRLGEVLKCTILAKYEKVPAEKLVGTIVAERAFDVISLAIVFLLAFTFQFEIVSEYGKQLFYEMFQTKGGHISSTKLLIVSAIVLAVFLSIRFWFNQFAHLKMVILFKKILTGIWEGLSSVNKLKNKSLFLFYSVSIWFLYIIGTWVGLSATVGTEHLGLPHAITALAFASIGMIVTPGGIGAYAFFMAKVLEKSGIPFELGFANGTLQWFAQFSIVLIVGTICVLVLPVYNKRKLHESGQ
jgi:uncharacterized protein (TIRG00374 family)